MAPLHASLHRAALHQQDRIFGGVETLASFFRSSAGMFAFCLGHNPTKIPVSTWLTSSKIYWIDIQFDSSKFTAIIRGLSSGCRDSEDTPVCSTSNKGGEDREKKHKSASIGIFSTQQRRAKHGIYLQQEPIFYLGVQL
jgi:hypothetical protein